MPRASAPRCWRACASRGTPGSTWSATARWASRASSPMRRRGSTACEQREGTRPSPFSNTRETKDFPEYYQSAVADQVAARRRRALNVCAGPVKYKGHAQLKADLDTLKAALAQAPGVEAFVPAIAPSNVETTVPNEYYPSHEAYVFAIAEAMREEYKAIVDAGFLLQIDDPFLVTYYITRPDLEHCRVPQVGRAAGRSAQRRARRHPAGDACASTPATASTWARASMTCSSRTSSTSSSRCVPAPIRSRRPIRATSTSGRSGRRAKLPDDKILIPGVITQSTGAGRAPRAGRAAARAGLPTWSDASV